MKRIPINLKFELIEYSNSGFSKGKCYVCYHGENRNGSFLAKEDLEKAIPTIFGIPVVGEYLFDIKNEINKDIKGNYTDHEGIEMRPFPIGFVPNDAKCYWETHGDDKEYLVVEGIILWTKRYPEANNVFDKKFNQSMEIGLSDENGGYYDENDKLYHITDFSFEALCVLGTDCVRNEDGSVSYRGSADEEPCFENSHFDTYSMKTSFKKEYELMLKEFKNFNIQGGKTMDEKLELLGKYSHLKEEAITEIKSNLDNYSLEELEIKLKETDALEFTLSINQIKSAIQDELSDRKIIMKDYWGDPYESQEFCMVDIIVEDKLVIVVDCCEWEDYYAIPYTMTGDEAELDFENKVEYVVGDWRAKVESPEDKIEDNTETMDFSIVKTSYDKKIEVYINKAIEKTKAEFDVKETEEFKNLNAQLTEVQEKYSKVQTEPNEKLQLEYNELKSNFDKTIKELEDTQSNFGKLTIEKENLTKEFELLTSDKEIIQTELNSYKLKEKEYQVNELFSKEEFSCLEKNEEFTTLKEKAIEMELSNVEEKLFVMLGKFASKTFSKKKEDSQIMSFGVYKYEPKEDIKDESPDYVSKWCKE